MIDRMARMRARLPHIAYGGDYNPEQWTPAFGYEDERIWHDDMRLMRLAHVNVATVGVFSWVALQPDETTFTFGWLDRIMDLLAENGIFACLGIHVVALTPSVPSTVAITLGVVVTLVAGVAPTWLLQLAGNASTFLL